MDYELEKKICKYLNLRVDKYGQVMEYYGFPSPDEISGWQMVCHISKLRLYLIGKLHKEHYKKFYKID